MRVGSALIVNDTTEQDLVGIFTERDLLRKFDQICFNDNWNKPVRTVMTQKLITLKPEDLEKAEHLMLRHKIRHLPITRKDGKKQILLGIVSIRDVLKSLISFKIKTKAKSLFEILKKDEIHATPQNIGVISHDESVFRLFSSTLSNFSYMKTQQLHTKYLALLKNTKSELHKMNFIVLDLDNQYPNECISFVCYVKNIDNFKGIIVLASYSPYNEHLINLVSQAASYACFIYKPVDVTAAMEFIAEKLKH